jgi:4'-phosphopantetheinyl transferase
VPSDDAAVLFDLLSPAERRRADAFRFERHRRRYIIRRARLRQILSRYGIDPVSAALVVGLHGKPELAGRPLTFNLAHSGELAMCAIALGGSIGIDVELVRRRVPQWERIARRYFDEDEARHLAQVAVDERYAEFLRIWTLKEACLKAAGTGLTVDPRTVAVAGVLRNETRLVSAADETWMCVELRPTPYAIGALAVPG